MPGTESKNPRPACVEDWDEDTQTADSSTRAVANAAVKRAPAGRGTGLGQVRYIRDGSDSGYSSKAGTIATVSTNKTNGKNARNLRVDTSVHERERQPYSMTAKQQPTTSVNSLERRPSNASQGSTSTSAEPFKHPPNICWVCDRIGYHVDPNELAKYKQPSTPTSAKPSTKKPSKADPEASRKLRRHSSTRESRPAVVYAPPTPLNFYPITPTYPPSSLTTPISTQPQIPYLPEQIIYTYPHATPITPHYAVYLGQPDYFIPQTTAGDQQPSKSNRLSSVYDQPVIHHSKSREVNATNNTSSKEAHPMVKSRQSSRSAEQQRADREAMPPPTHPTQKLSRRSSSKDSAVYAADENDYRSSRSLELSRHTREPSPQRAPPSAYKHVEQVGGPASRLQVRRKSVSYSDPITTTQVAAARPPLEPSTSNRRRASIMVDKAATHDQLAAKAEAYIERNSRLTAEQLTVEKIAEMKSSKPTVSSRSESGSNISQHSQHSQHSSSKSSSGHDRLQSRGRRTSILVDGVKIEIPQDVLERKGRPVSMQLGGVNISVGSKDKATSPVKRDQKLLEKAPSVASVRSKRSVTESSHGSSKAKGKH